METKKEYMAPNIEVTEFEVKDSIATSGVASNEEIWGWLS